MAVLDVLGQIWAIGRRFEQLEEFQKETVSTLKDIEARMDALEDRMTRMEARQGELVTEARRGRHCGDWPGKLRDIRCGDAGDTDRNAPGRFAHALAPKLIRAHLALGPHAGAQAPIPIPAGGSAKRNRAKNRGQLERNQVHGDQMTLVERQARGEQEHRQPDAHAV